MKTLSHIDIDAMIPWSIVRLLVGIGRTTAWRLRREGQFPQPRQIGSRQFWCTREIVAWQAALPTAGAV